MAILAVPYFALYLVEHSSGGAIVNYAGAYVANTFVSPAIVSAFSQASMVLAGFGSSASAIAASPYIAGGLVIAGVAAGAYCYFHGIPAPIAETLASSGLATPSSKGLMIAAPKLAVALVLMGAAGCLAYRFYKNYEELQSAFPTIDQPIYWDIDSAKVAAESTFGVASWQTFGENAWSTVRGSGESVAKLAQNALDQLSQAGANTAQTVGKKSKNLARRFWLAVNSAFRWNRRSQ